MVYICKPKRVSIYINTAGKKITQVKAETGCDALINGGLFNMTTFRATGNLKAEGTEYSHEWDAAQGYEWSGNELPRFGWSDMKSADNFVGCVAMVENGVMLKMNYPSDMGGARPRTAFGTFADGRIWMYATSVNTTPETLQQVAFGAGVKDAIMLDGGGSTQCIFPEGKLTASRVVHNFICVWTDEKPKEETTMTKYKVCLDAGHGGNDTANGSPDGACKEHSAMLDLAQRLKKLLEKAGIEVVMTRSVNTSVSLASRALIANNAKADIYISLHSNAAGSASVGADGWGSPKGLCVYTYGKGETLERNILANKIIAAMKAGGVTIHGAGLFHASFAVLAKTVMPAVLVEYGFHTNKEETALLKTDSYRDKLALCTAKAVCDYFGIDYKYEATESEKTAAEEWAIANGIIAKDTDTKEVATIEDVINIVYSATK